MDLNQGLVKARKGSAVIFNNEAALERKNKKKKVQLQKYIDKHYFTTACNLKANLNHRVRTESLVIHASWS